MLCHFCVLECHKGHKTRFGGHTAGFCDCGLLFEFCKDRKELKSKHENLIKGNEGKNQLFDFFGNLIKGNKKWEKEEFCLMSDENNIYLLVSIEICIN